MNDLSLSSRPGAWSRFATRKLAVTGLIVLSLVVVFALFGNLLSGTDAHTTSAAQYRPPTLQHLFGTDVNGRDLFARVVEGARISLAVGLCGAIISLTIGTAYGMIAGYAGGRIDELMMRFAEILYSIPRLIIVILAISILDMGLKTQVRDLWHGSLVGYTRVIILILTLGLVEWLSMARIVRGQVLVLKAQQFVLAARSLGQSHYRIIIQHLLPNLLGVIIVYLTLTIPAVIMDESFLSFLGLGIQPPQASWGSLLSDGAQVINPVRSYWWLLFFPAAIMSMTLFSLNFIGDALRDVFDPRASR